MKPLSFTGTALERGRTYEGSSAAETAGGAPETARGRTRGSGNVPAGTRARCHDNATAVHSCTEQTTGKVQKVQAEAQQERTGKQNKRTFR